MARNQSALANWSQYLALRGVAGFIHCFSIPQNLDTAGAMGSAVFHLFPSRRKRAINNLRMAFPDWSDEQINRVAEDCFRHFFQLFIVDSMAVPRLITTTTWTSFIRLGNIGTVLDYFRPGEPLLLVTGHCGNWEVLGFFLSTLGYDFTALARPLDNPLLNKWVMDLRESRGMRIMTKWGATTQIPEIINRGGRVGFIADQNAGDMGLFVPFFGRLASTYKSIGLMAMRYKVPIVVGVARRVPGKLEFVLGVEDIINPEEWADSNDPLFYITARYCRGIEMMIRKAPDQYLWMHRRWKSRPGHEHDGKPIPPRLIRKLESLPWMTDGEMRRLVELTNNPPAA